MTIVYNGIDRQHRKENIMSEFYKEMCQQPESLELLLERYKSNYPPALALAKAIEKKNIREFVFTGMGSSYFIGYIACAILRKHGIQASAHEAKEFATYGLNTLQDGAMLFIISQSGSSKEILELCEKIPHDDNITIVTNNENKPLYERGIAKFLIYAGDEYTTATKTYTNTIAAVLCISDIILKSLGKPSVNFLEGMRECINKMRDIIDEDSDNLTHFFKDAKYICLVGGGASYCSASHAELVLEEAGKLYSTRYLPAQFLHGPVELIDTGFNVIAFDFSEDTREETDRIIDNVLTYGGKICVLSNRKIELTHPQFLSVYIDLQNEFVAPLLEIIPIELFVYKLGEQRGLNPGILTRVRK